MDKTFEQSFMRILIHQYPNNHKKVLSIISHQEKEKKTTVRCHYTRQDG